MLRFSKPEDIDSIISVWNESFGDSEKDIKLFIDAHFIPENTLVYECDGIAVSVLFLIDGEMHINGTDYSSYYLYAACTLKKYRGRGLMQELLDFAQKISLERRKFFIALKPGEDSLYDYYSKFGYKPLFTKKITKITFEKKSDIFSSYDKNIDLNLSDMRNSAFDNINYFKWNKKSIEFASEHHKYYGGKVFCSHKGYSLYIFDDSSIHIKESTFISFSDLIDSLNHICNNRSEQKIIIESPCDFNYGSLNSEIINSGMILPVCEEAEKIITTLNNAYLALTLD